MKKMFAYFLLITLFTILLLTGCSPASQFTYSVDTVPFSLDPQLALTSAEQTAVVNLFEGLYRRQIDGSFALAGAESVDISADQRVYTFVLPTNWQWPQYNNAAPFVTADDFVFAFQRIFDKHTVSPWSSTFAGIENAAEVLRGSMPPESLGVRALSSHILEITLSAPDPALPDKLTLAGAMPCNRDFFTYTKGEYGLSVGNLLANGPFYIYRWSKDEMLELRRNQKDNSLVNTIQIESPKAGDTRTTTQRYSDGIGDGMATDDQSYKDQKNTLLFETTSWVLVFNCDNVYLSQPKIRKALAEAALQSPLSLAELPGYSPADGLVPPGVQAGINSYRSAAASLPLDSVPPMEYMRAGLASIENTAPLDSSTQISTEIPTLTVLVPENHNISSLMGQIGQRWQKELSCYFPIKSVPMVDLTSSLDSGNYDIALVPIYATANDAAATLAPFAGETPSNPAFWHNAEFNKQLNSALVENEPTQRLALTAKAEQILLEEWPVVPLCFETTFFVTRRPYKGLSVNPFGPVLDFNAFPLSEK